MKKLFITSAILTISTFGGTSFAFADPANTFSEVEFVQTLEAVKTSSSAVGMHNGDFQATARTMSEHDLYSGAGAALMVTVRRYKF